MPRLTKFEEYRDRYPDYALEKTGDGILLMRMHRDGGPMVWDERAHHDTANLFNDVAGDRDVRVVIYTGTGDSFNANWGSEHGRAWDSCFTQDHGHIHGKNFRPTIKDRYRMWLTHKLASWIDQFGMSGCVGCGRCITWCPVGIDLTEELRALTAPPAPA